MKIKEEIDDPVVVTIAEPEDIESPGKCIVKTERLTLKELLKPNKPKE
ncbi:MAG: hypothetical protein GY861_03340 [bacterium]|nr:hypothetical protein [bacterium]